MDHFELLQFKVRRHGSDAGEVSAWPCQTLRISKCDGITDHDEDDGYGVSGRAQWFNVVSANTNQRIRSQRDEIGSGGAETLGAPPKAAHDDEVLSLYPPESLKRVVEN